MAARTKSTAEPKKGPSASGSKRVTTAVVLRQRSLLVFQRVAAIRGSQGQTELSEAGVPRPYSVSALIREILEAQLGPMERELAKAGIVVPQEEEPQ